MSVDVALHTRRLRHVASRHPSAFLLAAQLLSLLVYPLMDDGTGGRLMFGAVALVVVPLVAMPLLFGLWAPVRELQVGPMPLWWFLLGILVYPAILGVGWWYVRQADPNEAQFTDLVEGR